LFFTGTFVVDPGIGAHISHKINHSKRRANIQPIVMKKEKAIVFQTIRVSRHCNNDLAALQLPPPSDSF
jgi:ribosomal protein L28